MRRVAAPVLLLLVAAVAAVVWFALSPSHVFAPPVTPTDDGSAANGSLPAPRNTSRKPGDSADEAPDESGPPSEGAKVDTPVEWRIHLKVELENSLSLPGLRCTQSRFSLCYGDDVTAAFDSDVGALEPTDGWKWEDDAPPDDDYLAHAWNINLHLTLAWAGGDAHLNRQYDGLVSEPGPAHTLTFRLKVTTTELADDYLVIRGRLVHSSGRELDRASINFIPPMQWIEDKSGVTGDNGEFAFRLRAGHFGVTIWSDEADRRPVFDPHDEADYELLAALTWALSVYDESPDPDCIKGLKAKREGKVFDFGDIEIGGAILFVDYDQPKQGDSVAFHVDSGDFSESAHGEVKSLPFRLLMPAGVYAWKAEAEWWVVEDQSPVARGTFDADEGGVVRLKLKRPEIRFVELLIEDANGPVDGATLDMNGLRTRFGEGRSSGVHVIGTPYRLLRNWLGEPTFRFSSLQDLGPADVQIREDVDTLTIKLDGRTKGLLGFVPRIDRSGIRDLSPKLTPAYFCRHEDGHAGWFNSGRDSGYIGRIGAAILLDAPGRWEVSVYGGLKWGYPGGLISGPVSVVVRDREFVDLDFPKPVPPPWKQARAVRITITCGGEPFDGFMPKVLLHNGQIANQLLLTVYKGDYCVAGPVAVVFGNQQLPLEQSLDTPGLLEFTADLPPSLLVKAPEGKGWPDRQRLCVLVTGAAGWQLERGLRGAELADGVLCGAPPGPATVKLIAGGTRYYDGFELANAEVHVAADKTTQVDLKPACGEVTFRLTNQDGSPRDGDATGWRVLQLSTGKWIWVDTDTTSTVLLPLGSFRALIAHDGWYAHVDFEVTGTAQTVDLKMPDAVDAGRVCVSLPPDFQPGEYCRCWYAPCDAVAVAEPLRMQRAEGEGYTGWPWDQVTGRQVKEGMLLSDLPVGVELCLCVWNETRFAWVSSFTISGDELQTITPQWRTWRTLDSEWIKAGPLTWRLDDSGARFTSKTRLPVGRPELELKDGATREVEVSEGDTDAAAPGLAAELKPG